MEPEYIDDAFDDRDMSVDGQGFLDPELCMYVMDAVGRTRKQFKTDAEIAKWRRVDKAFDQDKIPLEWINDRIKYAQKYHWSFTTLVGSILNTPKMEEWVKMNRVKGGSTARKEQTDGTARKP